MTASWHFARQVITATLLGWAGTGGSNAVADPGNAQGVDERATFDRTTPAYRQLNAIGVVTPENMRAFGTGFLVDECHVLTSQHGFTKNGLSPSDPRRITFSVGQTGRESPPFLHMRVPGTIIRGGAFTGMELSTHADWVVIRLSKAVGREVGYISIYQMDPKRLSGRPVVTAGFPADRTNDGSDLSRMYGDANCKS